MSAPGATSTSVYGSTNATSGTMSAADYFMNGYQGPFATSDFSSFSSAQGFIPMAALNGTREVELSQVAQSKASNPDVKAFAAMIVSEHLKSNQQIMALASSKNITLSGSTSMAVSEPSASNSTATTSTTTGTAGNLTVAGAASSSPAVGTGSASVSGTSNNSSLTTHNFGAMSTSAKNTSQSYDLISLHNLTGNAFDLQYMRMMLQDHQQAIALFTSAAQSSDKEVNALALKTLPALQSHFNHAKSVHNQAYIKVQ